jgi:hypothetical protein
MEEGDWRRHLSLTCAAYMYASGSGRPRSTSSAVITAWKNFDRSNASSASCGRSRGRRERETQRESVLKRRAEAESEPGGYI